MADIWGLASILTKLALYAGLAGAMGLTIIRVAFADQVRPLHGRMRFQTCALSLLAMIAAVLSFMLNGAALTGGADGMVDREMLGLLWGTPVGTALVYRVIGPSLVLAGLFIPHVGHWIALAGGGLALWSFAQVGHVPGIEQTGVRLLLLLHLLGICFWIGILGPLRHLSRRPEYLENAALLGHRFGQAAALIVPGLILAGIVMAWWLLGDLSALFTTGYGRTLLVKLALVGVILALAAANKLRFVPALQAGDESAARHLARSVELEAVLILLVLTATATLTSVLPLPS